MGRKHSKNAGVMGSEALSYHEKKALGHGTVTERLGKVHNGRCGAAALAPRTKCGPAAAGPKLTGILTTPPALFPALFRRILSATTTIAASR